MTIATIALTALFGAQPPYTPVVPVPQIDSMDVHVSESAASIVAYDASGEVVATIEAWESDDGQLVYFADFADGFAEYTLDLEGHSFVVSTDLEARVVDQRIGVMADSLLIGGFTPNPQKGVLSCGVSILAAVGSTAIGNAPGATLAGIATVCNCTPLIFKKAKCPDLW
ncbi:hypothetical protein [Enhygromyxa salina]|uniref:Uncharacterized protein n=1 Tax=Enhygromyxa salina TaxID=215803 RepID=A0A2S9YYA9_9BACT|nr:hypothetical protein [Enhygromyxa salina]PRQ10071.1 hypothetical protein ENSA7_02770 [Enhygromyxa salina]